MKVANTATLTIGPQSPLRLVSDFPDNFACRLHVADEIESLPGKNHRDRNIAGFGRRPVAIPFIFDRRFKIAIPAVPAPAEIIGNGAAGIFLGPVQFADDVENSRPQSIVARGGDEQ